MDINEKNRQILIQHFERGSKKNCIEELGVELEHFIVDGKTLESISYYGEKGIEKILEAVAPFYPHRFEKDGHLIGLYNDDYSISLEPAGQLEISINPREGIAPINEIYEEFLQQIQPVLDQYGYQLIAMGYQPKSIVEELALIPKKRYQFMDEYFKTSGTCGIHMMRGTAATQVAIDYNSEADFVLKYRAAYILMPLFELLTDNSPIFKGKPYGKNMLRSYIWDNVDSKRAGIIPGLFSEEFGFATYAEYLMNLPLIFIPDGEESIYTNQKTVKDIWTQSEVTAENVEHILSMTFLDVRLKNYVEIRFADSMPFKYVRGYLALIKGIFYNPEQLDRITSEWGANEVTIEEAKKSLSQDGFDGKAYGYNAAQLLLELVAAAKQQLDEKEQQMLDSFETIIKNKRTLAKEYDENNIRQLL